MNQADHPLMSPIEFLAKARKAAEGLRDLNVQAIQAIQNLFSDPAIAGIAQTSPAPLLDELELSLRRMEWAPTARELMQKCVAAFDENGAEAVAHMLLNDQAIEYLSLIDDLQFYAEDGDRQGGAGALLRSWGINSMNVITLQAADGSVHKANLRSIDLQSNTTVSDVLEQVLRTSMNRKNHGIDEGVALAPLTWEQALADLSTSECVVASATLSNRSLDWAVACALGCVPGKLEKRPWGHADMPAPEKRFANRLVRVENGQVCENLSFNSFAPSASLDTCFRISNRERISLDYSADGKSVTAKQLNGNGSCIEVTAPDTCLAAIRCFVIRQLGLTVKIPSEVLTMDRGIQAFLTRGKSSRAPSPTADFAAEP